MHIHILGICGTFMGGLARLASALGHQVSGSDENVYPPMSEQLQAAGIQLHEGYDPAQIDPATDIVIIGNALSRGNPAVEYVLNSTLAYTSGPEFLAHHILRDRWVLAVAGTHGKTTTSSMLAWILEDAGLDPGFLIGGVPGNFAQSARLGSSPFFIVEADEYDSAFFDKRSKFIHYHPRTTVINNIEFDHADIFPDLAAIKQQFHHLLRTLPANGLLITPKPDEHIEDVLKSGCWTPTEHFCQATAADKETTWWASDCSPDLGSFTVRLGNQTIGKISWPLQGRHNVSNALAAIAAARHAGVPAAIACESLSRFAGVKRRMEKIATIGNLTIYDDFAHHPTAIATTLDGLRKHVGKASITTILELRSNTMKAGIHRKTLPPSLANSNQVILYEPDSLGWKLDNLAAEIPTSSQICKSIDDIINTVLQLSRGENENIVIMSNGDFDGLRQKLLEALNQYGQ